MESSYKSPISFGNGHVDTLVPHFFRRPDKLDYKRERIDTPDGDFIDIDWVKKGNKKLLIMSHGLESNTNAKYIRGMATKFLDLGHDIAAWNCRGCSGELNLKPVYYHSGVSYDLRSVVEHALVNCGYSEVYIIGFSMGANISLKYLGEESGGIDSKIKAACVFSAPCNLEHGSVALASGFSWMYTRNFIGTLRKKVEAKTSLFEEMGIDTSKLKDIKSLSDFDNHFTAPLNGFKDAKDYYTQASSIGFIKNIKIPTLIINAKNDPFLAGDCYPYEAVSKNEYVTLEVPETGGHCGFFQFSGSGTYWSEDRASEFLSLNI
jgi:predicted alpha/beta-fold hydrolase